MSVNTKNGTGERRFSPLTDVGEGVGDSRARIHTFGASRLASISSFLDN